MSTGNLLAAAVASGSDIGGALVLGTVISPSDTAHCYVRIDGAVAYVEAIVPAALKGTLMQGSGSFNARVMGVRVGSRFYVTDVISGGAPTEWVFRYAGSYSSLIPAFSVGSVTCPAGVLSHEISLSGFNSGGNGSFGPTVDGTNVTGSGPSFYFNIASTHMTFPTFMFRHTVTAGTHALALVTATVLSDSNDQLDWKVNWEPA